MILCTPDTSLVEAHPASFTSIGASDYGNVGTDLYSDDLVQYADFLGANSHSLNAAGLAYLIGQILSPGYAAFAFREKTHDRDGNNPGWNSYAAESRLRWYAGTHALRPRLVVYYYSLPSVSTQAATAVTKTSATLNGNLTEDGDLPTEVRFQYGDTIAYGNDTPWVSQGEGAFTYPLTGLEADHIYHFRAQARNAYGTVNGVDRTIDTYTYYSYAYGSIMWANWPRPGGVKTNVPVSAIKVDPVEIAIFAGSYLYSLLYTETQASGAAAGKAGNLAAQMAARGLI
jgi:hypothetical protein